MHERKLPINTKTIGAFCRKHHIASLALFGSILTSQFGAASDVDVLVKFEKDSAPSLFDLVDIETELTSIMGRRVDLKTANDLSPYFRDEVLANSKVIYG